MYNLQFVNAAVNWSVERERYYHNERNGPGLGVR